MRTGYERLRGTNALTSAQQNHFQNEWLNDILRHYYKFRVAGHSKIVRNDKSGYGDRSDRAGEETWT